MPINLSSLSTSALTGASGTSGYSGVAGTIGVNGASGTSGTSGYSGVAGTIGTNGESGTSGYSGTAGASGTSGTSGTSGRSGYSGSSGAAGTAGPSTSINATDDTSTATLYPVMVGAAASNETPKVTTSKLTYNASTGTLSSTIFNTTSDAALKTDVEVLTNVGEIMKKINGVSFNWKNNNAKSYGVIAQNIEEVIPEAVAISDNVKSVNYNALIAFLIEANKELQNRVEQLERKLH